MVNVYAIKKPESVLVAYFADNHVEQVNICGNRVTTRAHGQRKFDWHDSWFKAQAHLNTLTKMHGPVTRVWGPRV